MKYEAAVRNEARHRPVLQIKNSETCKKGQSLSLVPNQRFSGQSLSDREEMVVYALSHIAILESLLNLLGVLARMLTY